jgi:hypothetical protein
MEEDPYVKTATACFQMGRYLVHRVAPTSLDLQRRKVAECEVVCVLIHFLSRILFQLDRASIDARMSALSTAALRLYAQAARDSVPPPSNEPPVYDPPDYGANNTVVTREMYEQACRNLGEAFYHDRLDSVSAEATETFMNLYCDRMFEYSELQGNDWLRRLLARFGKNLSSAVNAGDESLEVFLTAEAEAVRMFDALGDFVPQMLSSPAT